MNLLIAQVLVYKDMAKPCLHGMGEREEGRACGSAVVHAAGGQVKTKCGPLWCLWFCIGGQHVGAPWYGTSGSYDGYLITGTLWVDKLAQQQEVFNTREPYRNMVQTVCLCCRA